MYCSNDHYLKKIEKKFLKIYFALVIIRTVHLDVWIIVQVRSFLRILCGVWTTTTTTVVVRTLLWCGNSLIETIQNGNKWTKNCSIFIYRNICINNISIPSSSLNSILIDHFIVVQKHEGCFFFL